MGGEGKRLRMNIFSHAILQFILELLEVSAVPMFTVLKVKIINLLLFQFVGKRNIASTRQYN